MGRDLFEKEQNDLLADLKDIPRKASDRRVCLLNSLDLYIERMLLWYSDLLFEYQYQILDAPT